MTTSYPREVFELILDRLSQEDRKDAMEWHEIRSDGVYLERCISFSQDELTVGEKEAVTWHPLKDLSLPALPFPFTASQLAAFCFPGEGSSLLLAWENCYITPPALRKKKLRPQGSGLDIEKPGLDEARLAELGSNGVKAREVIRDSHRLLLLMNDQFRLVPASSGESNSNHDTDLDSRTEQALAWLLRHGDSVVGRLDDVGRGLATGCIAEALNGIGDRDTQGWKDLLSDPPVWIREARMTRGKSPDPSTWNPVTLGMGLQKKKGVPLADLDRFFDSPALALWIGPWKEASARLRPSPFAPIAQQGRPASRRGTRY